MLNKVEPRCRHCHKVAVLNRFAFCVACSHLFDVEQARAVDDHKQAKWFGLPTDNAKLDRQFDKRVRHGYDA